jgi:hypothetical protein
MAMPSRTDIINLFKVNILNLLLLILLGLDLSIRLLVIKYVLLS